MSGEHWRSLGELEDTPESRAYREREFPEGASEAPDAVSRRTLLQLLGATVGAAGIGAACRRPEEHIVPYVEAPEQVVPGVPRYYATTMPNGTSAYGLVVESHEGRPTKLEGNELHPASLGSSSARVQASVLDLYDPDRSQTVLRRGERSSWADFVAAWTARVKAHSDGEGLAVLATPSASPTLARLAATFQKAYPRARFATWAPVSDANALAGLARAAGRPLVPVYRLEKAKAILAIDADLLNADPEMIRHTRAFAGGRRVTAPGDAMSRLWAVEAVLSITGANADHRLRLPARRIPAFVAALAAELRGHGLAIDAPAAPEVKGLDAAWLRALGQDLVANRGASLIVAGPRQPAAVHAAVAALNAALGNVSATVEYREPTDALLPSPTALADMAALGAGQVKTLVVLGGNPAYDAPADLAFAAAAAKAEELVHFGSHVDETAALASWHLPSAHFLEAWGDARAICGTLSVVQPLILPLYGAKSIVEVLGLLATGDDTPGHELVQASWRPILGEADFEKRWNRVLHDGVLPQSTLPGVKLDVKPGSFAELASAAQAPGAGDLELGVPGLPQARRRCERQQRLAPGAAGRDHEGHLGQPAAREPRDGGRAPAQGRGRRQARGGRPQPRAADPARPRARGRHRWW